MSENIIDNLNKKLLYEIMYEQSISGDKYYRNLLNDIIYKKNINKNREYKNILKNIIKNDYFPNKLLYIIKLLEYNNFDIFKLDDCFNDTTLHIACRYKNINAVKILYNIYIKKNLNLNLNIKNKMGNTPLHLACASGGLNIVKYITNLNIDIDINIKNNNGETPFYTACVNENFEIVKYLSNINVDIDEPSNDKDTPFEALCYLTFYNILKYLIEIGVNTYYDEREYIDSVYGVSWTCDDHSDTYIDIGDYIHLISKLRYMNLKEIFNNNILDNKLVRIINNYI